MAHTGEETAFLQQDNKNLFQWFKDWQMIFSVKKCKSMQTGHNTSLHECTVKEEKLQSVTEENDLGIIIYNNMKPSKYVSVLLKRPI